MQWKGPFEVIERVHGHDYRIELTDRVKMFHANMLKNTQSERKSRNFMRLQLLS